MKYKLRNPLYVSSISFHLTKLLFLSFFLFFCFYFALFNFLFVFLALTEDSPFRRLRALLLFLLMVRVSQGRYWNVPEAPFFLLSPFQFRYTTGYRANHALIFSSFFPSGDYPFSLCFLCVLIDSQLFYSVVGVVFNQRVENSVIAKCRDEFFFFFEYLIVCLGMGIFVIQVQERGFFCGKISCLLDKLVSWFTISMSKTALFFI